jgi:hypothetical protein
VFLLSGALTYLFQKLTGGSCYIKLWSIIAGNLLYWVISWPLMKKAIGFFYDRKYFVLKTAGLCITLVTLNQFLITELVDAVFILGFDFEYLQRWCTMIFENNILANGIICAGMTGYFVAIETKKRKVPPQKAETISQDPVVSPKTYLSVIPVKNGSTLIQVPADSVCWIGASNNTITLYTEDKKYVLYRSLTSIHEELDPSYFVRIHRSIVVNKKCVSKITTQSNGDAIVQLHNGTTLRMSRHYRAKASILS